MDKYDVCVIGAGLIGSAAAKYCALNGARTVLIGPNEPAKQDFGNEDVFGAWFDEGRIARTLASDVVWAYLAVESSKRYRKIESESGIPFFTENGYMLLCNEKDEEYLAKSLQPMKSLGNKFEVLDKKKLNDKFPYLNVPDGMIGVYEDKFAGTINPRRMVQAQLKLFTEKGGECVKDVAMKVERNKQDSSESFLIHTRNHSVIESSKILVCAGAFHNHYPILPTPNLDCRYRKTLVSRIRIEPGPLLDSLIATMPSFGFVSRTNEDSESRIMARLTTMGSSGFYGMRPTRYPDGNYYVKIGYNEGGMVPRYLDNARAVTEWFRSAGSKENLEVGRQQCQLMRDFIAGLDTSHYEMDTCVNLETPTNRPYIGTLDTNFYSVTGGNGYAAKSSDELGRLGARIVIDNGMWPSDYYLSKDMFTPRFISTSSNL